MRITHQIVKRVADYAEEFTGGAFRMQAIGGDIGHGIRFIDGVRDHAWYGSTGAREACAYYYGGIEAFNSAMGRDIGELPDWLIEIKNELTVEDRRPFIFKQIERATGDAHSRMRRAYGDDFYGVMGQPGFVVGNLNTLDGKPEQ